MSRDSFNNTRGIAAECKKFAPNIFNKSKCSSCFKQKEEHSAEALESNRSTRKICKCGYLFVAPGWDFSNPLNRTKRWQRRWFVLYDDGELSYSVDEHPETVPQATIDMTSVIKVSAADDVTGHPFSLAITSAERITFIKGTCQEESRWWADILQVYSVNKDRHKRNATFPSDQSPILQITPAVRKSIQLASLLTTATSTMTTSTMTISPIVMANETCQKSTTSVIRLGLENVPIGKELGCINNNKEITFVNQSIVSDSPPIRDKTRTEDKMRRKIHQRINLQQRQQLYYHQQKSEQIKNNNISNTHHNENLDIERKKNEKINVYDDGDSIAQVRFKRTRSRISEATKDTVDPKAVVYQDKLIRGDPDGCVLDISGIRYSPISELRLSMPVEELLNIKKGWLMKQNLNMEWNKHWFVLRGCSLIYYRDPGAEDKSIIDGIIDLNTVTAVTPVQVSRNYGFQTETCDEKRSTIFSAITAGIRSSWISAIRRAANLPNLENSLELHIFCQESQQNFNNQSSAVSIIEREKDTVVTSTSVTPRSMLFSSDEEYRTASEGGRRESGDWSEIPVSPSLTKNNKWLVDTEASLWLEDQSRKHEWSELPPSPPLMRTALSRVKARSRSNSRSRVYKRSRSSPLSSRQSTLDSIKSEDIVMACYKLSEVNQNKLSNNKYISKNNRNNPIIFDLLENQLTILQDQIDSNQSSPNSLLVIVERQENEIKNLKLQLNTIHMELINAENKISKLKHDKNEIILKEKQIDSLLSTVQNTEQQRNKYLENVDEIKKLYNHDKELLECKLSKTEKILRETTEKCQMLTNELSSSHVTQEHLQLEITTLSDRLAQGIEENERLYTRIRQLLEGKTYLSSSKERGKSFDSLSDLTNIDLDINLNELDKERVLEEYKELKNRFEKAILEIRAMRKELREAHALQDALELQIFVHKQEVIRSNESNEAQIQLMAARIQDLTNKLACSEKQVRTLKQKLNKVETRDKRRSLSLKGKESLQISQEVENKLLDLENRICKFEQSRNVKSFVTTANSLKELNFKSKKERSKENSNLDKNIMRRKSLDNMTCSEPMKVLIRLSTLETKIINITDSIISDIEKDTNDCNKINASINEISLEVLLRLRKFEKVISKSKRRLENCLESIQAEDKSEECVQVLNEILDCIECKKNRGDFHITESVKIIICKLESILKDMIFKLMKKREQLALTSELNEKKKVKLIAQRIVFEFIILKQIKSAMEKTLNRSAVLSELVETSQLILNLKFKVNRTKSKIYQNTSYIQYLTKVLANKLVLISNVPNTLENSIEVSAGQVESFKFLVHKQNEMNHIVKKYKNDKLRLLAEALAIETFSLSEQELGKHIIISDNKLIEDKRILEAWTLAQETVNKELVQAEASRFFMHWGQIYDQNISFEKNICLHFDSSQNINLKSWAAKAQTILRQEMEYTIHELTAMHKDYLIQMNKNKSYTNKQYDLRQLLLDYTDILAQKALIDARIILLQKKMENKIAYTEKTFVSSLIEHEDIFTTLFDENYTFINNPIHDAEYFYLHQQFPNECEDRLFNKQQPEEQIKYIAETLMGMADDLDQLKKCLKNKISEEIDNLDCPKLSIIITDWDSICEKCYEIREQIKRLINHMKNIICTQCEQLQHKIQWLTNEHSKELEELRKNQAKDLIDIKENWDNQRNSLTIQYEHEVASLRDRAKKLEYRLNAIDSDHASYKLRTVKQRSVSTTMDTDAEIRKRYKEEIKQLRALCEKGLLAMENSHRRIISELEEKHRHEIENLQIEKEQALSEETQATLAALDAMRKAHEHEVQKEIAKFKQEFIKQVQVRKDVGLLHKEHEQEMEEIKKEILSLSAKYSSKCVECAALEEKVGTLTKQIVQAEQQILKLNVRNEELHSNLLFETNDSSLNNTIQFLRNRDNQITIQQGEIHLLQQQLKHSDDPHSISLSTQSTAISYLPVYSP